MNESAREFALLSFLRDWLPTPQHFEAAQSLSQDWHAHAARATIAEGHLWLEWGAELGFFPREWSRVLTDVQREGFLDAFQLISNEDAYERSDRVLDDADHGTANTDQDGGVQAGDDPGPTSLHAPFQQLARLAAAFAKQRPAATMLATITLERPVGRFSFYEHAGIGKLTGDQVAAALAAGDESAGLPDGIAPTNTGALGVAGLLQTLDYFASIRGFFDSLYGLPEVQTTQLSDAETTEGTAEHPLTLADVRLFERRFVACQGWRINLRKPRVLRRFVTLMEFASGLIGEELAIDYGRVVQRMVDERTADAAGQGETLNYELLDAFDPRQAVAEWRQEAQVLIENWVRRLRRTAERGTPPALATTAS